VLHLGRGGSGECALVTTGDGLMEQKTRKGIKRVPPQKTRYDDDGKPEFTTEAVRKLIAEALPERELVVKRDALISAIVERIETWKATKPQIEPHNEKIRRLVAIAKQLEKAVEAAGNELRKLGADQELRDVYIYRAALTSINPNVNRNDYAQDLQNAIDKVRTDLDAGTQTKPVPLNGHSALLDLYVLQQSIASLWLERSTRWNRFWRPGEGRPRDFDVSLTAQLQWLCRKVAGCSAKEFGDFLQPLNDSIEWRQAGLPKLLPATLKKRTERDKKKRRDKLAGGGR
jgi:hypothetical protein